MLEKVQENRRKVAFKPSHLAQEVACSITQGVGLLLSGVGLILLVTLAVHQSDVWRVVSVSIYGGSLMMLFAASSLYHGVQVPKVKAILQKLDHCSIFLLIAGTYTPFLLITLRGVTGFSLFVAVWSLAIVGIVLKIKWGGHYRKLFLLLYLLMGWMVVLVSSQLLERLSMQGVIWLVAGGLFYTVGTLFYLWRQLPFNHTIWHFFVLAGSACHFFSVLPL